MQLTIPDRPSWWPADRFRSPLHSERTAAVLGLALGVTFSVCFLTGLWSHLVQHPPDWFSRPPRPAGLYRVSQGVHVATGLASIPLLFAKLWTVYPKLFTWPPFRSVATVLERIAILPLIGGGIFLLLTGLQNINLWYPWSFNFIFAHWWAAWLTIGALVVHVGAKITTTRRALRREPAAVDGEERAERADRRAFLGGVAATSGLVTLVTVGQTFAPLERLALLAPRRPSSGPQGFPVNRTAAGAGVTSSAVDPGFRLVVAGRDGTELSLSIDDLRAMSLREAVLPIACVEGWSVSKRWRGVPVADLLELAGADRRSDVRVQSLQRRRAYRASDLQAQESADPDTLLALDVEVDGELVPLDIDHGYPLRLIAPNRPGVLQTKWVTRLVVR